jgi:arylsulfatase A-like enzyme
MSVSDSNLDRRAVLKAAGLAAASAAISGCEDAFEQQVGPVRGDRPNILWITCEDISPALGCYGDKYAITPNLDQLAAEGLRYTDAYATAPVCSPARSCLITGMYATSLGTQHLRSDIKLPENIKCFTEYLRKAGYHCSNNYKQDYNFEATTAWDESSKTAHWRKRKGSQPFFSVFNSITTHQSQIDGPEPRFFAEYTSNLKPEERHDPAEAPVPPFYPDTPVVRQTLARYYDLITLMDKEAGHILDELEQDGLAEDTIVFFFSDHGFGMPRFKRTLYDTGLRVPLIVRLPKKYRHPAPFEPGTEVEQLVSFVDFAPTVLSLAGVPIPEYMQGQAFLGDKAGKPREYIFGASSRVDEAYELSRCVRDRRYKYIRNYMPHLPYAQRSAWPDQAAIAQELRRLAGEDKLAGAQKLFFSPTKPIEELYDTQTDPYELNNLARRTSGGLVESSQYEHILKRLRQVHRAWVADTRDIGFLPEAEMHIRAEGKTPYEIATDFKAYPQQRIVAAAELVGTGPENLAKMTKLLGDSDSGVRYWAAVGLGSLGNDAAAATQGLKKALSDSAPNVRFAAAGALCELDQCEEALNVLVKGLDDDRPVVVLAAARELQNTGDKVCPVAGEIKKVKSKALGGIYEMFIRWALEGALHNCRG